MRSASQNISNELPQITKEISKILTNSLTDRSTLPNEVQGFTEYHFLSFSNRTPIQVENLFGPKFTRNFDPSLQSAIQDIVSNLESPAFLPNSEVVIPSVARDLILN